jgi:hypothetical protein
MSNKATLGIREHEVFNNLVAILLFFLAMVFKNTYGNIWIPNFGHGLA